MPLLTPLHLTLTVGGSLVLATLQYAGAHDAAGRLAVRLRAWDLRLLALERRRRR